MLVSTFYLLYLGISIGVTVWVARTLSRNGRVFLVNGFGAADIADSVNHMLVVGFYLVNIGYVALALKNGSKPVDLVSGIEFLSYKVGVVQNPLTTLADDVAATDRVIARMGGPVILVGHSYGGTVITEAGDNPNVAGLVYIAAFAPDAGESTFGLIPTEGPQPPIEFTEDQYGFLNRDAFLAAFAPDVEKGMLEFMADSQIPPSLAAGTAAT